MLRKVSMSIALLSISAAVYANGERAGEFDTYKLAITWAPGFCAENLDKQECQNLDNMLNKDYNYAVSLHGLWPNVNGSTTYGDCIDTKFSKYNPSSFNNLLLNYYEPAAKYCDISGFCLPEHEWNKHGTCQLTWDQPEFFYVQTKMIDTFRKSLVDKLENKDSIRKQDLYNLLIENFKGKNKNDFDLICNDKTGKIKEIRITLNKNIENISDDEWRTLTPSDLSSYIIPTNNLHKNCGDNIVLK
ncbi:hypothetical protein LO80_00610 [Candidatus Francisella endociliophora]|uniref:Uncharacterized protein n=1 Tax=Candidatus Francisella endociliophora TaxID=653937 RepID=A0A097EM18_9GAMM|nr:hypothetical protein [Francisella sp. FSC1006]AIT08619.1 hypothetical protein LO80_00610 [Francisella sp. FSC1006]